MKKIFLGLAILTFLSGCSDVWLGDNQQDVILEGERISIIPSALELEESDFLEEKVSLPRGDGFPNYIFRSWNADLGKAGLINLNQKPVLFDGHVYVFNDRGVVTCINSSTGVEKWQVLVSRKKEDTVGIFGGGIAVNENSVLVSTGFGDVLSLDKDNGGMLWRYSSIAPFSTAPYVQDKLVILTNRENETIALTEKTGEVVWKHKGSPEDASIVSNLQVVGNSRVIVPAYTSGEVFALVPQNGKNIWSDILGGEHKGGSGKSISNISAGAVVSEDVLFSAGLDEQIFALNLQTGNRIWQKNIKVEKTPLVIEDYLFVFTKNKELVAMSAKNGGVYWSKDLKKMYKKGFVNWSHLSIYRGHIVMSNTGGEIIFFSAEDGSVSLRQRVSNFSYAAPVFHNDQLYLQGPSGNLSSYRMLNKLVK